MDKVKIGVVGINFDSAYVAQLVSQAASGWFELVGLCDLVTAIAAKLPINFLLYSHMSYELPYGSKKSHISVIPSFPLH